MEKPTDEREQKIALESYRQAYREIAELIEDLRGKDVGEHGDHFAGLWAACHLTLNQGFTPWDS